jgi:hypothetical protein
MLRNEAYAGVWHFARRRWTKVPGTNVRRPKPRSPNDRPVAQERPHLRIIDEKTWSEVQCRLTEVHLHYTRQSAAKSSISGRPSQYPFSGILVCDHCGSLMFVYGKGTGRRYRCTGNAKRGICTNRLSVLESTVRTCLLSGLRKHLTNDSAPASARRVSGRPIGHQKHQSDEELRARKAELAKTEARIRVLIEQMADGESATYIRTVIDELAISAKGMKAKIAQLEAAGAGPVASEPPGAVDGWVNDLPAFVERDPLAARELLRKLLRDREVRLEAQPDGVYIAKAELAPDLDLEIPVHRGPASNCGREPIVIRLVPLPS